MRRREFLTGMLAASFPASSIAQSEPTRIPIEDVLDQPVFHMICNGNGKWVQTFASNSSALHARADSHSLLTAFRFVRAEGETVKLYSVYHRNFVSAIGRDWPLFPRVEDEAWTRFAVDAAPGQTFTLRSTNPAAQAHPYISVIGESRILRIAEGAPRAPWSYFVPYRV